MNIKPHQSLYVAVLYISTVSLPANPGSVAESILDLHTCIHGLGDFLSRVQLRLSSAMERWRGRRAEGKCRRLRAGRPKGTGCQDLKWKRRNVNFRECWMCDFVFPERIYKSKS